MIFFTLLAFFEPPLQEIPFTLISINLRALYYVPKNPTKISAKSDYRSVCVREREI